MSAVPAIAPVGGPQQCNVLLFGDLTIAFEDDLRQILHCKNNGLLQCFFDQVNLAFRHEFALLPAGEQDWLPRFTDLVDLVANFESTISAPALRFGLLCVHQLARFITSDSYPDAASSYLLGVCTGSFAAAAISSSRTMTELIPAGIEATLAAVRTGLHSLRMQRDIEISSAGESNSWSIIINLSESEVLEVLRKFSTRMSLSRSSQPYVSAVTPSAVTISGPSRILRHLIDSFALKIHSTRIRSPYHAAHLNTTKDVDEVFGHLRNKNLSVYRPRIPLLSTTTGTLVEAEDFSGILRHAVTESLCEQIRWDKICSRLPSLLSQTQTLKSCVITPFASNAASLLSAALQQNTHLAIKVLNAFNPEVVDQHAEPVHETFQDSKIAIVGFSGRFPEASSNDELWEVLKAARDCHRNIPEDRFGWEAHYDPSGKKKNTSRVKYGCFVNDPGVFDTRFFNISPREAETMDPGQRLALMTTYEAIEMAGLVPDRTPSTQRDRIGVFFGATSDDWREVNSGQDIDTYFIPGSVRAFVPGRISYFFRLSGPSISVDTACSSSFAAISTACGYLWRGDCDTAIAGGTNILTNPDIFAGLDRGHFLSTTGNCNTFDDSADGYCRADAVGAVVLKRLEDAEADHDPIFGVIVGSSTNHSGQTVSITRPHEGDQLSLFKSILRHTNTKPSDVSYIEMHGTGTQAGDATEMRSVLSAFAWDRRRASSIPPRPLHLGAVKANVGHSEAASGVTALIKVLMMMRHNEIPPHRLNGQLNRHYPTDLTDRNVHIAFEPTAWRREDCANNKRMSFLNNFSAAGGNTAILLEDAPRRLAHTAREDLRSVKPVTVSAKTIKALEANLRALNIYLDKHPNTSLSALSYTTTARRTHYNFRILVSGPDINAIKTALKRYENTCNMIEAVKPEPPKIVFVFTGQGALYTGIGKQLYDSNTVFRTEILRFDRIARCQGFPSFLPLVMAEGCIDAQEVDPVVAQLAIVCVQMALSRLWTLWVGKPCSVIGHSLGEYAALQNAGVLSVSDAIHLVGSRARLLTRYCTRSTHSMLAVRGPLADVASDLAKTTCTVACINSPLSTTISGPAASIQQLSATLKSKDVDAVLLDVPYAFHSAQLEPMLAEFHTLASTVHFGGPKVPYMSPLLSETINEPGVLNASYVVRAARECVNFQGAIEAARGSKVLDSRTTWIEIGLHPICTSMIKQIVGSDAIICPTLKKGIDPWKVLNGSIESLYHAGANIQWNEFHRDFEAAQKVLPLPSYKWDLKNYWIQYRYNFCLTKGDDPTTFALPTSSALPTIVATEPTVSPSVHRVLEERSSYEISTLLIESDLQNSCLTGIVSGHKVNTAMLCPSSLYSDMAFTIARYMLKSNGLQGDEIGLNCRAMTIGRPLIVQPEAKSQLLRASAKADWSKKEVLLSFYTVDSNERKLADHACCTVNIVENHNWIKEWKRSAYLISSRISALRQAVDSGNAHKLKRGLAYKLFGALVDYAPNYRGMDHVILDTDRLEATAEVKFQVENQGFDWNPYWMDNLGHIAGFIMNGNDNIASKDQVFINHGWDAMRLAKPIDGSKTYTTYNRMQLESGTMYVGDTYVFEGEEIVGIFEGIRFQGVNRSVLDFLLPSKVSAPASKAKSRTIPTTRPHQGAITPASHQKTPVNKSTALASKTARALKIMAEEIRIDENVIDFDADLTDLGLDSLLSLTIVSRLHEELEIEISSSAFVEYPTMKALLNYIGPDEDPAGESVQPLSVGGEATTPYTSDDSEKGYSTERTSVDGDDTVSDADVMAIIRNVISKETGTAIEDLASDLTLTDLGIDSLLGLTIMSNLSEQLDTELPSNLFAESETLHDIEDVLRKLGLISNSKQAAHDSKASGDYAAVKEIMRKPSWEAGDPGRLAAPPHATSVLLQGSLKTAKRILFLLPDGAGSASSYHALPEISPSLVVYGLNCPWLKTPQDLKCSLEQYVAKFVIEIRRRQPHGPYYLGGMSAGGILAYEAARQLHHVGEKTGGLILLDSPDPVGLENPNDRLYDFLDSINMFGINGEAPKWLRPHFDAFLVVLDAYNVQKFPGSSPPTTHIIYARDGICKYDSDPRPEMRDDDPREMRWLLNNRTDFSGGGWRMLLGAENLSTSVLDDVNHYTILRPGPMIKELSKRISHILQV